MIVSWKSLLWLDHILYTSDDGHMIWAEPKQGVGHMKHHQSCKQLLPENGRWKLYRSWRKWDQDQPMRPSMSRRISIVMPMWSQCGPQREVICMEQWNINALFKLIFTIKGKSQLGMDLCIFGGKNHDFYPNLKLH